MVAAEFWEQGDLEKTVLEQQPIVRSQMQSLSLSLLKCVDNYYIFPSFAALANDGPKSRRRATEDAVWFHRLCLLLCLQGAHTQNEMPPVSHSSFSSHLLVSVLQEFARFHSEIQPMFDGLNKNRGEWRALADVHEAKMKALEDQKRKAEQGEQGRLSAIASHHLSALSKIPHLYFYLLLPGGGKSKTCVIC